MKKPCHSFENVVAAARSELALEAAIPGRLDAWVSRQLEHLSASALLDYCKTLHQWGGRNQELAQKIAQSPALAAKVVSGSRKLDDGTYDAATVPPGCITRGDFLRQLSYLGIQVEGEEVMKS